MPPIAAYFFGSLAVIMTVIALYRLAARSRGTLRDRHYSFPRNWLPYLERNVPFYTRLPFELRIELQDRIITFVDGKAWQGCGGIETVTDEMKVTISAYPCLMEINKQGGAGFGRTRFLHVYPASYLLPAPDDDSVPVSNAWPTSAIVLAWDGAAHNALDLRDRQNTALGEIASRLGIQPGPAGNDFQYTGWARTTGEELAAMQRTADGTVPLAEKYSAADPVEFFAVATEVFFEQPGHLQTRHRELYDVLSQYYKLHPVRWRQAAA